MPTGDVLVIGAGPAGINAAYALDKAGLEYRVIDRATVIASTWNSLYPSLHLNTSRFFSPARAQVSSAFWVVSESNPIL